MIAATVIAQREFFVLGTSKRYKLEVYAPCRPPNDNGNWLCEIKMHGDNVPEGLDSIKAGGTDSYQALHLGLKMAKTLVLTLNRDYLDSKLRLYDSTDDLYLD